MSCVVITHSGYVFLFWWLIQCHYFTSFLFSRPAFLNCFSWVGHEILKIRTLLMMYITWAVYNCKTTPLGWRKDMFSPWRVLDKVSCWTQHAVVLIHSRQSAVCYEKCIIMRGQFCTHWSYDRLNIPVDTDPKIMLSFPVFCYLDGNPLSNTSIVTTHSHMRKLLNNVWDVCHICWGSVCNNYFICLF